MPRRPPKVSPSLASILRWPMLLTILVSVSGWGFVYLVESLVAAPLVEYGVAWKGANGVKTLTVNIENLSRTNRIKDFSVGFASREKLPGKFSNAGMQAIAPAAEGQDSIGKIVSNGLEVQFEIMDLQPRRAFHLWATYSGIDTPQLRLLGSDGPVYLHRKGVLTFIAKYSVELVGLLTILFTILLIGTMYVQAGHTPKKILGAGTSR